LLRARLWQSAYGELAHKANRLWQIGIRQPVRHMPIATIERVTMSARAHVIWQISIWQTGSYGESTMADWNMAKRHHIV